MTTGRDAVEVHPFEFVTVNVREPAERLVMVAVVVDPVILPGLIVHAPTGKPLRMTLPVGTVHDGCVIVPIIGAMGSALTVTAVMAEGRL